MTHNRFEIVEFLLDHGIDVNKADAHGNTALLAAIEGEIEDTHFLAETTGYLPTPSADMTQLLLNRGANVNCMNDQGHTPLGSARHQHPLAERLLLNKGAKQ